LWKCRHEAKTVASQGERDGSDALKVWIMEPDLLIEHAVRRAQALVWEHLPPTDRRFDEATIEALRRLVRTYEVEAALARKDTFLAFVLRAVQRVVGDDLRTEREKINALWSFLDDPELKKVLRIPKNARIRVRSRRGF